MAHGNKVIAVFKQPRLAMLFFLHRFSHLIKDDKLYYKWQYRLLKGKKLNIDSPITFSEKLQWLKLYDRKDIYTTMVDKLAVKDYVARKIGKKYVIPLLGVWSKPEDIDYDKLPDQFVIKATHGGGCLDVVICRDKSTLDVAMINKRMTLSLKSDYWRMREWPYKHVPRKIIAEELLESETGDLWDYKVMCFGGQPKLIQVHRGRFTHQTQDIYDTNWNKLKISQPGYPYTEDQIKRPELLEEMIGLSATLAEGIPQIRVDWYLTNGKLYFGELTFFDAAGYADWEPEEWNKKLGDMIILPNIK